MHTLVLALNPSIDAEWRVHDVLWEEKNNVQSERRWAGGKGINVARWLKHLGGKPRLLLPLGGVTGSELALYLRAERISSKVIRLGQPSRVNVIVTTRQGRQMRFNPLGPTISAPEWKKIISAVRTQLAQANLLVLSGSLPRGLPVNVYGVLIRLAHRFGVKTLLDCDGAPLSAALSARPLLVKPNEHELAQWWGKPLRSEADVLSAACALSRKTRGWVLVSRGGQRSLLVNEAENLHRFAMPRRVTPRNTVGAGDALLAAVARGIQLKCQPEEWLERGLETGTRATQLEPGRLPKH
ncbi:MAG TPA: 1-phosphofructokinase family hexose kinase [Verrucomicrobiae bacterium]|nr:1-phosphofructokinase family hexose kinase [Verrucomicrobiae bacterium]